MTWLEPMWLAYPTVALLIATAFFAFFAWQTLRVPVPELNYVYEPRYARTYQPIPRTDWAYMGVMAATACVSSSASAIVPVYYVDPRR